MSEAEIVIASSREEVSAVKAIFLEYLEFIEDLLGAPLDPVSTKREFEIFPEGYDQLYLALINNKPVAACGVKTFKPGICELKRLYCRPEGRGHNLGVRLTEASINGAQKAGFTHIYLDTDPKLTHAIKIYEDLGFEYIERYYEKPNGCSRFMALALAQV